MQLDKTRVVIRERSYLDILELSLQVTRGHALPLLAAWALGVVPFLVLNDLAINGPFLAIDWLNTTTLETDYLISEQDSLDNQRLSYYYILQLAILVQTPLATAPMTLYLSQALFVERPKTRQLVRDLVPALPGLTVYQFLLRGSLTLLFLGVVSCQSDAKLHALLWFFLGGLLLGVGRTYFISPYFNEIILLERVKLAQIRKRSRALHRNSGGLLFGRWLATICWAGLLTMVIWASLTILQGQLIAQSPTGGREIASFRYLLPLSIWMVVGFLCVVRFLSYLDLRIRREGWEIELKMRAEAKRLGSRLT